MTNEMNDNIECILRFGHCDGHTDCTFISDQKLMTCGVDFEVRIWPINETDDDSDDVESFSLKDQTYAIVSNLTNFFIACDSNCVKSYSLSDGENETTVCRFTTNTTHLDISSDGNLLVASAADFTLKLINLENKNQKTFEGHDAPILSVALDPKHKFIASSSCDSSVRIWNIENENCVHFWSNCYPKSNDFENSQTLCRICWEPINGELVAIPKLDRIDIYQRESWDLVKTLKHQNFDHISIATYSSDGNYLAVGSNVGIVMVWDIKSTNTEPIAKYSHNKSIKITTLKWNPNSSKQLCLCDISGQFGVLNVNVTDKQESNKSNITQEEMNDMFADLSDDDFKEESNDEIHKNAKNETNVKLNEKNVELNETNDKTVENGNEDDSDMEFDIGAIKSKYESQIFGNSDLAKDVSQDKDVVRSASRMSAASVEREPQELPPLRQEPFQPGSTPAHFAQRFMVWNSVGIVRSYNTENENSIDADFHDVTYHHSIHLPNVQNYTIADLSTDALILATNGDQNNTNAKLFCMLFNIWDSTKEWQMEMPSQEYIEAITCGSGFIAIATDKRFIRILTTGGIQTNIFSISGRIVCLSSYEQFLMIIYHTASGMPEEQSLSMYILRIDHKCVSRHPLLNPVPVALSPKSQLSWAGFTDEGTACVVDYEGIVRLYKSNIGNTWVPIASTKEHVKGKSDNYFIIGLSEIQNQIRCIFCKGMRFPPTLPKPTLTLLPLQMPLCEILSTKGKYEEEMIRNRILVTLLKKLSDEGFEVDSSLEECNKNIINSLIKLFALALGADRESLAIEITRLMPNKRAVEGAIRYAERQKRRLLAQKLSEIAEQLENIKDESEDEVQEIRETIRTSNLRIETMVTQSSSSVQLKPKALKSVGEDSNSKYNSDESETELEKVEAKTSIGQQMNEDLSSNDSHFDTLKPLNTKVLIHKTGNPFKVNESKEKSKTKRKNESESSDESDDDDNGSGFKHFYEEMRQIIKDDNSDVEEEEELVTIAKQRFRELEPKERKSWAKMKSKKRKVRTDLTQKNVNKENTNKITKFFTKN